MAAFVYIYKCVLIVPDLIYLWDVVPLSHLLLTSGVHLDTSQTLPGGSVPAWRSKNRRGKGRQELVKQGHHRPVRKSPRRFSKCSE